MNRMPIYCGHGPDGNACTELAEYHVTGPTYTAVTCHTHLGAEKRAAGLGRTDITIERVQQPEGAVRGDGQGALFGLPPEGRPT